MTGFPGGVGGDLSPPEVYSLLLYLGIWMGYITIWVYYIVWGIGVVYYYRGMGYDI